MSELRFEGYTLQPHVRELRRGDMVVPLTRKAFELLHFFALNAGGPLRKADILEAMWPGTFVEESNLNQNVFVLRRALGADGERLIVTLPRVGYQFTGVVAKALVSPVTQTEAAASQTTLSELMYEERIEDRLVLYRSPAA